MVTRSRARSHRRFRCVSVFTVCELVEGEAGPTLILVTWDAGNATLQPSRCVRIDDGLNDHCLHVHPRGSNNASRAGFVGSQPFAACLARRNLTVLAISGHSQSSETCLRFAVAPTAEHGQVSRSVSSSHPVEEDRGWFAESLSATVRTAEFKRPK
jgi:hypothetical protein